MNNYIIVLFSCLFSSLFRTTLNWPILIFPLHVHVNEFCVRFWDATRTNVTFLVDEPVKRTLHFNDTCFTDKYILINPLNMSFLNQFTSIPVTFWAVWN